ncbi:unnamed protein product [Diplocarpon coronariae]|uniref:Uncharacterized protein n=1 Tax=Diplocarpon coronariae TaxID=2795749 RepID=A0A218YT26_9HELO|nr:hypothetical protein JHW43_005912 [Diplocarpon mali]OWO97350.1 hypothetical protein B2J93_8131 [Marssonina coronariae]
MRNSEASEQLCRTGSSLGAPGDVPDLRTKTSCKNRPSRTKQESRPTRETEVSPKGSAPEPAPRNARRWDREAIRASADFFQARAPWTGYEGTAHPYPASRLQWESTARIEEALVIIEDDFDS